ncbi:hypothetical protein MSS4_01990 [Mycobacterium marinum]|nr:hypothetical protein MSS4_01990 [Mycobacterium marinum]CDM77198.1 hypothetical protein MMARE11_30540 [Mycobacterium marinum E11]
MFEGEPKFVPVEKVDMLNVLCELIDATREES